MFTRQTVMVITVFAMCFSIIASIYTLMPAAVAEYSFETHLNSGSVYICTVDGVFDSDVDSGVYNAGQTVTFVGGQVGLDVLAEQSGVTSWKCNLKESWYEIHHGGIAEIINIGTIYDTACLFRFTVDLPDKTFDIPANWAGSAGVYLKGNYNVHGTWNTAIPFSTDHDDVVLALIELDILEATNNAPSASAHIEIDGNPDTGLVEVQYKSTSTDSDGTIVRWDWVFGDGESVTDTAQQGIRSHFYFNAGTYELELTVTDDRSATDTFTTEILVESGGDDDDDDDPTTSNLYGFVKDYDTGEPIAGATVEVNALAAAGRDGTSITSSSGYFQFTGVAEGTYEATTSADGYNDTDTTEITTGIENTIYLGDEDEESAGWSYGIVIIIIGCVVGLIALVKGPWTPTGNILLGGILFIIFLVVAILVEMPELIGIDTAYFGSSLSVSTTIWWGIDIDFSVVGYALLAILAFLFFIVIGFALVFSGRIMLGSILIIGAFLVAGLAVSWSFGFIGIAVMRPRLKHKEVIL